MEKIYLIVVCIVTTLGTSVPVGFNFSIVGALGDVSDLKLYACVTQFFFIFFTILFFFSMFKNGQMKH